MPRHDAAGRYADPTRRMRPIKITAHVCNAEMRNWIFVRAETDMPCLIGRGEAKLEFKTRAVVGTLEDPAPLVVGRDARNIEHCFQIMTRHSF